MTAAVLRLLLHVFEAEQYRHCTSLRLVAHAHSIGRTDSGTAGVLPARRILLHSTSQHKTALLQLVEKQTYHPTHWVMQLLHIIACKRSLKWQHAFLDNSRLLCLNMLDPVLYTRRRMQSKCCSLAGECNQSVQEADEQASEASPVSSRCCRASFSNWRRPVS